jgi:hypothetical protein
MFRYRILKVIVFTVIMLAFATTAYAFAATNTVPSSYAGEGAGAVSGYTVSALQYNLNAGNPSNIDSVQFTLNAAATDVQVRLVTTGSYFSCTNVGLNWTCLTPGVTVLAADEVRVIARDH